MCHAEGRLLKFFFCVYRSTSVVCHRRVAGYPFRRDPPLLHPLIDASLSLISSPSSSQRWVDGSVLNSPALSWSLQCHSSVAPVKLQFGSGFASVDFFFLSFFLLVNEKIIPVELNMKDEHGTLEPVTGSTGFSGPAVDSTGLV